MVETWTEHVNHDFQGTIIDLETIGEFDTDHWGYQRYLNIKPVIFGINSGENITIYYVKTIKEIPDLIQVMKKTLPAHQPHQLLLPDLGKSLPPARPH